MSKTQREGLHFNIRTMQSTYTPKMRYWTSVSLLLRVGNLGRKTPFSCAFCSILPQINQLWVVIINLHCKLDHLPLNTIPCCPKLLKYVPVSSSSTQFCSWSKRPKSQTSPATEQTLIRGTELHDSRVWLKGWMSPPYRSPQKALKSFPERGMQRPP